MLLRAPYIAYRLLNEALHRITGIDREASVATTVFTAGVLGGALLPLAAPIFRVFRVRPHGLPSPAGAATGLGVARSAVRGVAGEPLHETPLGDVIIVACMAAGAFVFITAPVTAAIAAISSAWRYLTRPAR